MMSYVKQNAEHQYSIRFFAFKGAMSTDLHDKKYSYRLQ